MDMWNEKLTRENISDFYQSSVEMVYPSVFEITKEPSRTERAIIKSYLDTYQQRGSLKGEDVIYVFGDILLNNANEEVEKYPLPENLTFAPRVLDEYTRNFMLEKILAKIDSTGYKVAEFISSDNKRGKGGKVSKKFMDLVPVTPLLLIQLILLALIIWGVSFAAISLRYRNDELIKETRIFDTTPLQEKYVAVLPYYPLDVNFPEKSAAADPANPEPQPTDTTETSFYVGRAEPEVSATRG
ncbi:MAG: hypothetical protein IKN14_03365 [Clostridiales bacterium]|nr:hypothetical protein [Clostridiales bacterium]